MKHILVFEGIDGCGKTYAINQMEKYLDSEANSPDYMTVHNIMDELGAAKKLLYNMFTHGNSESIRMVGMCVQQIINKFILTDAKLLLCSRWLSSTYAYQVFSYGMDRETFTEVDGLVREVLWKNNIDLTYIFRDSDYYTSLNRIDMPDQMDNFALKRFEAIMEGYREYFDASKENYMFLEKDDEFDIELAKICLDFAFSSEDSPIVSV